MSTLAGNYKKNNPDNGTLFGIGIELGIGMLAQPESDIESTAKMAHTAHIL
jgi:hypothetical protein